MKNPILKLSISALFAVSTLSNAESVDLDNFSTSDVVGMFADIGVIGAKAGEKTVTEAHVICLNALPSSELSSLEASKYDGDSHSSYKQCMAEYVPFRVTGDLAGSVCPIQDVKWGECEATLPSQPDGETFSIRNAVNTDMYEGFSNYQCSGGDWKYLGGGCSRAANKCEEGEVVSWAVTTPLWADPDINTPFVDKFGITRHSPKGSCYASMPEVPSGKILSPNPTVTEMTEPERFNFGTSVSHQRCFDKEWIAEPAAGAFSCEYIPKSCTQTTYTHKASGCEFNIEPGEHDAVFTSLSPLPENSVGSVTAHCWDGKWEVKSAFCSKSCSAKVPKKAWSPLDNSVGRTCFHGEKGYPERLVPDSSLIISNEREGMQGSSSYVCNNGTLENTDEVCAPKGCGNLPASSWTVNGNTCSHPTVSGEYVHGDIVNQNVGDIFSEKEGFVSYTCSFGEYVMNPGATCAEKTNPEPECDNTGTAKCPDDAAFNDGFCCSEEANGVISCFPSSGR